MMTNQIPTLIARAERSHENRRTASGRHFEAIGDGFDVLTLRKFNELHCSHTELWRGHGNTDWSNIVKDMRQT
jgi:hypothetical protein